MFKNPIIKNILSAIAVAVFGFILLGLTFIFDSLFHGLVKLLIKSFVPADFEMTYRWYPPMMHILFVVIIGLITWLIFRSKLGVLYKAIYMAVPVAVVLATLGIFFYSWPIVPYLLGGLFSIGVLYYFYRTKKHWLYYYTVILVSLTLLIATLMGVEI